MEAATDTRRDLKVLSTVAAALVLLGVTVWLAWSSPWAQSGRELEQARDRWDAREPSSYAFDYFHCGGMCGFCPVQVTVVDGAVVKATRSGDGCTGGVADDAPTIEDVFVIAADNRPGLFDRSSTVSYDPQWGFPTEIHYTCPSDTSDCGGGWSVSGFRDLG